MFFFVLRVLLAVVTTTAAANLASPAPIAFKNYTDDYAVSYVVTCVGCQRLDIGLVDGAPAQQFVPYVSGKVQSLTTMLQRNHPSYTAALILEIRGIAGSEPGDVLGAVSIPATSIPTQDEFVSFDFSESGVELCAGQPYFVVFRAQPFDSAPFDELSGYYRLRTAELNQFSVGYPPIHSQTGGTPPWIHSDFYRPEIFLDIRVVPEPDALSMLVLSCFSIPTGRATHRRTVVTR